MVFILLPFNPVSSTAQPCNTFDCAFQKAERILQKSTGRDKYELVIANLNDAENLAGNDDAKKEKIRDLREQAFLAIQKEKDRADRQAAEAKRQTKIADSVALANRRQAINAYANDLAYKSQIALRSGDRTIAFQLAQFASLYVEPEHLNCTKSFLEALYHNDNPANKKLYWHKTLLYHTEPILKMDLSSNGQYLAVNEGQNVKVLGLDS